MKDFVIRHHPEHGLECFDAGPVARLRVDTGKGRIAMQQHGQNGGAFFIVQLILLGAGLAQHNRVHSLKM